MTIEVRKAKTPPPIITIIGGGGVGKTTFASEAPAPYIVTTEAGQHSITRDADLSPPIDDWHHLLRVLTAIRDEPHEYRTLVIDSMTATVDVIARSVAEMAGVEDIGEIAYGRGTVAVRARMGKLMTLISEIRDERGMIVIMITHEAIRRIERPDTDGYDVYAASVPDKIFADIENESDMVGYLRVKTDLIEKKGAGKAKAVATESRILITKKTPVYPHAKARTKIKSPLSLPHDGAWDAFYASMIEVIKSR